MKKILLSISFCLVVSTLLFAQQSTGYRTKLPATFTSETFQITLGTNPGTFDFYPEKDIHFFPNPMNESAHLEIKGVDGKELVLSIYDHSGKILSTQSSKNGHFIIDGKNLSSGIYVYQLSGDEGKKRYSNKFVVIK